MPVSQPILLTPAQARVLGALVEKEVTTPDYYPLSQNALVNACNQLTNREPVMHLDDEEVRLALHRLEDLGLAGRARGADGRVAKYEHWLGEAFNFTRAETALLCVMLLRGPQTPGELRGRTDRLHRFEEITDVLAGLQKLMEREPSLVAVLARQPGTKESRYAHLLSGPVEAAAAVEFAAVPRAVAQRSAASSGDDGAHEGRIVQLESTVAELKQEVAALRQKIDDLFGDG
ncbi:MAG: YceH family protein [Terracidiphilus sp.]|nr:YceH family protein [Terracidiphilus sp.]